MKKKKIYIYTCVMSWHKKDTNNLLVVRMGFNGMDDWKTEFALSQIFTVALTVTVL